MMPANLAPLMSSASDEWATPRWLYDLLDAEYHFTLDPCATAENAKCERFYTQADNGLVQPWNGRVFVNPPYSDIKAWAEKAITETSGDIGAEVVVMLVPARTDTKWFQALAAQASDILFLKGRVVFERTENDLLAAARAWFKKRGKHPNLTELSGKMDEIFKQGAPFPSAIVVLARGHSGECSVEFGDLRGVE